MIPANAKCWVCGCSKLEIAHHSTLETKLRPELFAITDYHYGITHELHRCTDCGFIQASNIKDTLGFYEDLEDPSYEEGRSERAVQARELLKTIRKYRADGRLLDIGAGTGILVEEALRMGYVASGIEPSRWLQKKANEHNLPVFLGTVPHPKVLGPYDIVTFIDVLEHVSEPMGLLRSIHGLLSEHGIVLVVTPDIGSLIAKIMRLKWWHIRVAHVGYYNRKTVERVFEKAGFTRQMWFRPSWYFRLSYLFERLLFYIPPAPWRMNPPAWTEKMIIPLNPRYSYAGIFTKSI